MEDARGLAMRKMMKMVSLEKIRPGEAVKLRGANLAGQVLGGMFSRGHAKGIMAWRVTGLLWAFLLNNYYTKSLLNRRYTE
jgi:hypothetical protein